VHGLILDIETGKLEWVENGYQALETAGNQRREPVKSISQTLESPGSFNLGEMKFPEAKIGEVAKKAEDWLVTEAAKLAPGVAETMQKVGPAAESVRDLAGQVGEFAEKHWPQPPVTKARPAVPPKIPMPPPIRPHPTWQKKFK
jgi:hypothetical protein